MTQSSWNQNSYLNIKLGDQLSLKAFIFSTILVKLYLAKMCYIIASYASNCPTRYKQILSGYSLGCKNALNFACLPMKFHNCHHAKLKGQTMILIGFLMNIMCVGFTNVWIHFMGEYFFNEQFEGIPDWVTLEPNFNSTCN